MTDVEHDAFTPATEQEIFEKTNVAELSFDAYQHLASTTAVYPGQGAFQGLVYAALGLNGEAGEVAEQLKKTWRDDVTVDQAEAIRQVIEQIHNELRLSKKSHMQIVGDALASAADVFSTTLSVERKTKLMKELGDTLWYAAQVATELGVSLGDVAQDNLEKLALRKTANLIHGEGSDR
jgi:NTP pyrophosphatase (non-canonical NTP hydrolase)